MIYENILKLEIETKGFNEQEFNELKKKIDEKQEEFISNRSTGWSNFRKNFQRRGTNHFNQEKYFRIKNCKRIH